MLGPGPLFGANGACGHRGVEFAGGGQSWRPVRDHTHPTHSLCNAAHANTADTEKNSILQESMRHQLVLSWPICRVFGLCHRGQLVFRCALEEALLDHARCLDEGAVEVRPCWRARQHFSHVRDERVLLGKPLSHAPSDEGLVDLRLCWYARRPLSLSRLRCCTCAAERTRTDATCLALAGALCIQQLTAASVAVW